MYIIRNIFQLKFGLYKEAKIWMDEAHAKKTFPEIKYFRLLSDFIGDSYRLIMEEGMIRWQILKKPWPDLHRIQISNHGIPGLKNLP